MSSPVFSNGSLVHAASGALGSVAAMTAFYPLDTARLRLQVDEKRKARSTPCILGEIVKEEGLIGLYRGWVAVICTICVSSFLYFYCYHSFRVSWLKEKQPSPGSDLLLGFAAGIANVLVTNPLWVVNTRLKLQGSNLRSNNIPPTKYNGILDAIVQITRNEGVGALWSGTFASLLLVTNPAIQFMTYEGLKRQVTWSIPRGLPSVEVFIIGAVAKAVATIATYPLQTIQTIVRLRQDNEPNDNPNPLSSLKTMKSVLVKRVRNYGVLSLFKGLEAKLLQTVLTAALMFLLYENIVSWIYAVMGLNSNASVSWVLDNNKH